MNTKPFNFANHTGTLIISQGFLEMRGSESGAGWKISRLPGTEDNLLPDGPNNVVDQRTEEGVRG